MSVTPNRGLPLMEPSQAQPEVVYNAAMEILDEPITGGGGGPGSITVDALTGITQLTFSGPAVSVAPGATGEAVVTIDTVSGGSGGSSNITADTHPISPDAIDDEMEGVSLDGKWARLNQGSMTDTFANGSILLGGITDGLIHAIIQATPSTPYKIACKVSLSASTAGSGTGVGLIVRNASSGKLYCYLLDTSNGPFACYAFDNPTTFNGILFNSTAFPIGTVNPSQWVHMEIENDGTNLKFRASMTGVAGSYQQLGTVTLATFIGSVSHVGLVFNNNVSGGVGIVDWFRRTA